LSLTPMSLLLPLLLVGFVNPLWRYVSASMRLC
jgi:hypothetical protein